MSLPCWSHDTCGLFSFEASQSEYLFSYAGTFEELLKSGLIITGHISMRVMPTQRIYHMESKFHTMAVPWHVPCAVNCDQ